MINLRTTATMACVGLVLALSGCSSTDTADANAAWCEGAATVQSEVDKMAALIENGSPSDVVKTQWGAVQAAIEANSVPLSQLTDSVQDDIKAAYDSFNSAVEAIPADASPAEAAPQYKAAIEEYAADIESVRSEVGCS